MFICGQNFTTRIVARIKEFIKCDPEESRRSLSRRVCELMGWQSLTGKLQEMSCRIALARLDKKGIIELPEIKGMWAFQKKSAISDALIPEHGSVGCVLEELGVVEVVPVINRNSKEFPEWKGLFDTYHYLGDGPLCGAQIRYLITSNRYALLGGLSFSAPAWCLSARDTYIGWTENSRRNNLQRVVCTRQSKVHSSPKGPEIFLHLHKFLHKSVRIQTEYAVKWGLLEDFCQIVAFFCFELLWLSDLRPMSIKNPAARCLVQAWQ
jgi:hypothetical protein